jgi:hypothetical protein
VPVWYVAPLEMTEGTHWGQGYNQPTKGCSAEERPKKRPLTLTLHKSSPTETWNVPEDREFLQLFPLKLLQQMVAVDVVRFLSPSSPFSSSLLHTVREVIYASGIYTLVSTDYF